MTQRQRVYLDDTQQKESSARHNARHQELLPVVRVPDDLVDDVRQRWDGAEQTKGYKHGEASFGGAVVWVRHRL